MGFTAWILVDFECTLKTKLMARQNNNRNSEREQKTGEQRRDAASHVLRFDGPSREPRYGQERERGVREVSMNRNYLNDLYERSSI